MPEQNERAKESGEPLEVWREPHGPWKVDPGDDLSEFEAAVLQEVLNAPLESQSPGDHRLVTEDEWLWTIAGNA
jgi:hypothetical protein